MRLLVTEGGPVVEAGHGPAPDGAAVASRRFPRIALNLSGFALGKSRPGKAAVAEAAPPEPRRRRPSINWHKLPLANASRETRFGVAALLSFLILVTALILNRGRKAEASKPDGRDLALLDMGSNAPRRDKDPGKKAPKDKGGDEGTGGDSPTLPPGLDREPPPRPGADDLLPRRPSVDERTVPDTPPVRPEADPHVFPTDTEKPKKPEADPVADASKKAAEGVPNPPPAPSPPVLPASPASPEGPVPSSPPGMPDLPAPDDVARDPAPPVPRTGDPVPVPSRPAPDLPAPKDDKPPGPPAGPNPQGELPASPVPGPDPKAVPPRPDLVKPAPTPGPPPPNPEQPLPTPPDPVPPSGPPAAVPTAPARPPEGEAAKGKDQPRPVDPGGPAPPIEESSPAAPPPRTEPAPPNRPDPTPRPSGPPPPAEPATPSEAGIRLQPPPTESFQPEPAAGLIPLPSVGRRRTTESSPEARLAPPRAVPDAPLPREDPGAGDRVDPILHTVRRGENFWTISRLYYPSGRYYRALHAVNRKLVPEIDKLYVGTTIRVPPIEDLDPALIEAPSRPSAAAPTPGRPTVVDRSARPADGTRPLPGRARPSDGDLDLPVVGSTRPGKGRRDPADDPDEPVRPTYRVRKYDTLRSIARDTLGDARRYREILDLNRDVIDDPARLVSGQSLVLPEDATVRSVPR